MVKSHYLDAEQTDSIVARAYLARQEAGVITGHAAGESAVPEGPDLLDDVRAVFGLVGGQRLWHSELLVRLVELRPVTCSDWDVRLAGGGAAGAGCSDRPGGR